ncbi:hypothetical protein PSQ39_07825 [Curvibacter sp. HBC28]|uniref:Uncharacterized protein n=1 Tax=Curvibacter microcysteis TaxID=3026419 RepID=A0ABT5MD68_9BURK|nr:hypothetical protein [Curvibacter sp. HBC28]MDD0814533.1 hypothetical protein [Curvibacter sp. HBC28]
MTEPLNTPRWTRWVALLTDKTRFTRQDLRLIRDQRQDCSVVIHQTQEIQAQRGRRTGTGRSGAVLVSDEAELAQRAEQERLRLQQALPERAEQWLRRAPGDVQTMPAAGALDADAQRFGLDAACPHCQTSGQTPCKDCSASGQTTCGTCHGDCQTQCSVCRGQKKTLCPSCKGQQMQTCSACGGAGTQTCYAGCSDGKIPCDACFGRGRHQVTVVVDHGKGPATVNRDVDCNRCGGSGQQACRSCHGRKPTCPICDGRTRVGCQTCAASGKVYCSNCNAQGLEDCPSCRAQGRIECTSCRGRKQLDCRTCGAQGWTHVQERIFTQLLSQQRVEHAAGTPAAWRPVIEAAIGSSQAAAVGSFQLATQSIQAEPRLRLTRSWHGTVPGWDMALSVNDTEATLWALGRQEQLVGGEAAVDALLAADREAVIQAVQTGGHGARNALRNYLSADHHAQAVLRQQAAPGTEASLEVRSACQLMQQRSQSLSRFHQAWAWGLYALTVLPLAVFWGSGVRFRGDWLLTLGWPLAVALAHGLTRRALIPAQLAQFTQNKAFAQAWWGQVQTEAAARSRRGGVKYLALACAGALLALSPGQPKWLVGPLSELRLQRAQWDSADARRETYQQELNAWLRCDARHEDRLLATLKGLTQEGWATTPGAPTGPFGFMEQVWIPQQLTLLDMPVRKISYSGKGSALGRTQVHVEMHLAAQAGDLRALSARLQPQAEPMKTTYGVNKDLWVLNGEGYRWSAHFKMESMLRQSGTPGAATRKRPPQASDLVTLPSVVVGCTVDYADWLRLKS